MKTRIILILRLAIITSSTVLHSYAQTANGDIAKLVKHSELQIYSNMKKDPFLAVDLTNGKEESGSYTDNDKVIEVFEFSKGIIPPLGTKVPPLPQVGPNIPSFGLKPGAVVLRLVITTERPHFDSRHYYSEGGMYYDILPTGVYDHIQADKLDYSKTVGYCLIISIYTNPMEKRIPWLHHIDKVAYNEACLLQKELFPSGPPKGNTIPTPPPKNPDGI